MTIEKLKIFISDCEKISKGDISPCTFKFIEEAQQIAELLKDKLEDEAEREETAAFTDILK